MTLYLSKIRLNPKSPDARRDYDDPYEMHRTVMKGFPQADHEPRKTFGVLHRFEVDGSILVQSVEKPDWSRLPSGYALDTATIDITNFIHSIKAGDEYAFRLFANTIKKHDGKKLGIKDEPGRVQWLISQSQKSGFEIIDAAVIAAPAPKHIKLSSTTYEGALRVVNPDVFREKLANGIGASRAFGYGLLSIKPVS